ncbi:hypothetical protein GQ53DRAFT_742747 [Thozetella sp. PMI_491]|nr:hypothetical protein GQ53DRAFT_742747 [Thozetella sp. PMI_491]
MEASGTKIQTTLAPNLDGFTAGPSKGDSGSPASNTGSPAPTTTKPSAGNRLMNSWGDLKLALGAAVVVLLMAGQF